MTSLKMHYDFMATFWSRLMSRLWCCSVPIHFYDVIAPPKMHLTPQKAYLTHYRHYSTTCKKQNAKILSARLSKTLHSLAHLKKKTCLFHLLFRARPYCSLIFLFSDCRHRFLNISLHKSTVLVNLTVVSFMNGQLQVTNSVELVV